MFIHQQPFNQTRGFTWNVYTGHVLEDKAKNHKTFVLLFKPNELNSVCHFLTAHRASRYFVSHQPHGRYCIRLAEQDAREC